MTSEHFCVWLQGCFEMNPEIKTLNEEQVEILRRHLRLVFKYEIDPSYGDEKTQTELNEIHHGKQWFPHQPEPGIDQTLIRC